MSYLNNHFSVDNTNFHNRVVTVCIPGFNTKTDFENTFMRPLKKSAAFAHYFAHFCGKVYNLI